MTVKVRVEVGVKVSESRAYPRRPMVGVGGVVISQGRVLVAKRIGPPLKGHWSIPGGMLETGETLTEGLQREIFEETALEVRVLGLIDVFERIERDAEGKARYHFVVLDYLCEKLSGEPRAESDVSNLAWATPDELGKYSLSDATTGVILKGFAMLQQSDPALHADQEI